MLAELQNNIKSLNALHGYVNVPTLRGFNYSGACCLCFPGVNMTVLIAEGIGRGLEIICFHNSGTTVHAKV